MFRAEILKKLKKGLVYKMNKYLKEFLHRGMLFAGLGPIVLGIVYYCISVNTNDFLLSGGEILLGIVSTYLLAFIQAGATVFNQIESWPIAKSLLFHFSTLYIAYSLCYVINTWIPFSPIVLLVFTAIFIGIYLIVWITVYLTVKACAKNFNKKMA